MAQHNPDPREFEYVPSGFAIRLKQVIAAREEKLYEFYRHFSLSQQQITAIVAGKRRLYPEIKEELRTVLGERAFDYCWGTEPTLNPAWCRRQDDARGAA